MLDVISIVQVGDLNTGLAAAGMDKVTVANVDTDVGNAGGVCILEEDEVTGLQVALLNVSTVAILRGRTVGDRVAEALGNVVNQTGTVKTGG